MKAKNSGPFLRGKRGIYYCWIEGHLKSLRTDRPKPWSASTRRTYIDHVMSAFNYCVRRKKIKENPIHGIERPRSERRKQVISIDDERKVYEASKGSFRDILTVLRETGARPGEL